MTEPVYSSGVTTSTVMIGSSSTEPPFCSASRMAGAGGDFEGEDRGVDIVVGAVDQGRLDVDHGEAGDACPRP